jgi:hypothetical protein
MSRYFFHVVGSDHGEFRDGSGLSFNTPEEAARHATKIAVELAQDGDHYRVPPSPSPMKTTMN